MSCQYAPGKIVWPRSAPKRTWGSQEYERNLWGTHSLSSWLDAHDSSAHSDLRRCDQIQRLRRPSPGAKAEVQTETLPGCPVFRSLLIGAACRLGEMMAPYGHRLRTTKSELEARQGSCAGFPNPARPR